MRVPLAFLLAAVIAGCSSAPPAPADSADLDVAATPTATVAPPAMHLFTIHSGRCEATSQLSFGVPQLTENSLGDAECPFSSALPGDLSAFKVGLVEAVWVPGPSVTGAEIFVQSDHCKSEGSIDASGYHQTQCSYGQAFSATSPLRFEIVQETFGQGGADNLTANLLPTGASTSQAFNIYVTLFEGPVPEGYSAIGA
jgi:hypothetical protein